MTRSRDRHFNPALPPEYEEAFAGLPLGIANKVFLELPPGALPVEGPANFVACATTARTVSFTVRPAGQELVLAYFGGHYARELETQGALEVAAREELVKLFGGKPGRRIQRTTATAWVGDPWARGAYSAARPGFAHCRTVLARPVAERVFFAGDACTVDTFGAIHGAWASGQDAAQRVVAVLGSPRPARTIETVKSSGGMAAGDDVGGQ